MTRHKVGVGWAVRNRVNGYWLISTGGWAADPHWRFVWQDHYTARIQARARCAQLVRIVYYGTSRHEPYKFAHVACSPRDRCRRAQP